MSYCHRVSNRQYIIKLRLHHSMILSIFAPSKKVMEIKKTKEVQPNFVNRICAETRMVGKMETQHDMRIDGYFEGDIKTAGRLVIGETGRYKGTVQCKFLDVWGEFIGSVNASEVVTFNKGLFLMAKCIPKN